MSYEVIQCSNLVNDAVKDITGKSATITNLDTTGLVSLGKQLSSLNLLEGWFNAMSRRIIETAVFVRNYKGRNRYVLLKEHEFGAFVQKVYIDIPSAVDNPEWDIPNNGQYKQHSPYDVETTVTASAMIFSGKGTWSIEIVRPITQIKEAFTSASEMMKFIDGIYTQIENAYELEVEGIVSTAVNTAIADALKGGKSRNLLSEYNTLTGESLPAAKALYSADFIKYANKEINRTVDNMQDMSTVFNKAGYNTFTDRENLVIELLGEYAAASASYLESDTFHNELVKLPGYNTVSKWQYSGQSASYAFADCSKISITNDDINNGEAVVQGGIIAFVHDKENVAAYFGERDVWEMLNPRDRVMIHGEHATKGYAVDGHANAVVFYIA
ncbi:MAG: hypothetical protein MJZ37_08555 [Bacilli bacterium]|nr:hypothetical protein [Bacilli bacterium]